MSSLTTAINVQVDKEDKEQATIILRKLGLSMSTLINMTLKQVILRGGVPFEVTIKPSKDMKEALNELEQLESHIEEYKRYNNREELKASLLSDE